MCQALSLFGHEVGDHIRRGGKGGGNIAQLNMLAAEVDAHTKSRSDYLGIWLWRRKYYMRAHAKGRDLYFRIPE